jgi:hypothetical protein
VRKLSFVGLVDTAGINPKVLQVVLSCLFATEQDLLVASLALASAVCHVVEGNLIGIRSPRMGQYCIGWDVIFSAQMLSEAELASVAESQKTHCIARSFDGRLRQDLDM